MKGVSWRLAVNAAAACVIAFLVAPSLIVVPISFGNPEIIEFPPTVWSSRLFEEFLTDQSWLDALFLSLRIALLSTLVSVVLGVSAAYALTRGAFRGKKAVMLFLLGPIMIPHVVMGLSLYVFFVRTGIAHAELRLVMGHVVLVLPFILISVSVGLRSIDPTLEKAATIMGAGPLRVFWSVTIPLLVPAISSGALLAFLISLDEVVVAWFVSRAGYTTLPVKMFTSIQWDVSPMLAAISTILTIISVVVCLALVILQHPDDARR